MPPSPTTVPLFASVNETPLRSFIVPLVWIIQLSPPFVVRRIVPPSPTAVPLFVYANETPLSVFPCGKGFCQNQPCEKICEARGRKITATKKYFLIAILF